MMHGSHRFRNGFAFLLPLLSLRTTSADDTDERQYEYEGNLELEDEMTIPASTEELHAAYGGDIVREMLALVLLLVGLAILGLPMDHPFQAWRLECSSRAAGTLITCIGRQRVDKLCVLLTLPYTLARRCAVRLVEEDTLERAEHAIVSGCAWSRRQLVFLVDGVLILFEALATCTVAAVGRQCAKLTARSSSQHGVVSQVDLDVDEDDFGVDDGASHVGGSSRGAASCAAGSHNDPDEVAGGGSEAVGVETLLGAAAAYDVTAEAAQLEQLMAPRARAAARIAAMSVNTNWLTTGGGGEAATNRPLSPPVLETASTVEARIDTDAARLAGAHASLARRAELAYSSRGGEDVVQVN